MKHLKGTQQADTAKQMEKKNRFFPKIEATELCIR